MSQDTPVDSDILRAARGMIEQHGQRAVSQAEARAAELMRHSPRDAGAVWRRIAEAIRAIQGSAGQDARRARGGRGVDKAVDPRPGACRIQPVSGGHQQPEAAMRRPDNSRPIALDTLGKALRPRSRHRRLLPRLSSASPSR